MTNRVPAYAVEPLKGFLAYTENVKTLLNVSMRSIAMTRNVPQMFEAFGLVSKGDAGWDENKHQAGLARAQRDALFAAKECDTGFPLLHEFTLVAMWGAFEAAIEDVIIGILCNEPELLRNEPFSKVRIPLAEFETLDKEERMRILLREIQRALRSDQKLGVSGFESVLDTVRLSGPIEDKYREAIWEMHHART